MDDTSQPGPVEMKTTEWPTWMAEQASAVTATTEDEDRRRGSTKLEVLIRCTAAVCALGRNTIINSWRHCLTRDKLLQEAKEKHDERERKGEQLRLAMGVKVEPEDMVEVTVARRTAEVEEEMKQQGALEAVELEYAEVVVFGPDEDAEEMKAEGSRGVLNDEKQEREHTQQSDDDSVLEEDDSDDERARNRREDEESDSGEDAGEESADEDDDDVVFMPQVPV